MSETGSTANFCTACGAQIQGGRFCANCGTPSGVHQAITPQMAAAGAGLAGGETSLTDPAGEKIANGHTPIADIADAPLVAPTPAPAPAQEAPRTTVMGSPATPPQQRKRGTGTWIALGAIVAALIAAAVVLVIVLGGGGDDGPTEAQQADVVYKQQVAKVFGPVLGANQQVSDELAAVRGTAPNDARLAVRRAQQATTQATGGLSALTAPAGEKDLAGSAQQVLVRETAYLAAVASVLNHPTVVGASQMQTLESNLTSALSAAGPVVAGEQPTISGADRLTSWARTTSRTLNRRAAAKRAKARAAARARSGSSGTSGSSAAPSSGFSNGTSCGGGLYAGPNTSCSFAQNVRDAYNQAPGASASVRVYSPVTDRTYTMSCRPSGSGVTCSGGNNASVAF